VRLNSVTPNSPPTDEFFTPDPGTTLTRLDVEGCAGTEGLYMNSIYWIGFLEDNTSVDPYILSGDLPSLTVAPGACLRGTIDLEVPDGHTVSSVVMRGSLFDEVARWSTASTNAPQSPLTAGNPITANGLAETVTLSSGATAVVRSVTPGAPPLDDFFQPAAGRQLVRVDVELCAGSSPLNVNPIWWFAAAADNRMGSYTFASTLPSIDIAAGECAAGLVEIDMPADAIVSTIVLSDNTFTETARWRAA
jgi:hypothetical protein